MKKAMLLIALLTLGLLAKAQDVITTTQGEEIKAKVAEVTPTEIKYRKFDNLTGALYTVKKSDIFMIKYENGTKDVFGTNTYRGPHLMTPGEGRDLSGLSMAERGKLDANEFYNGSRSCRAGTMLTSIFFGPVFGLIPAIAFSSTPPKTKSFYTPNPDLMKDNDYFDSYKRQARHMRRKRTWSGYLAGSLISIGTIGIVVIAESAAHARY